MAVLGDKIQTWYNNPPAQRIPAANDLGNGESVCFGGVGPTGVTGIYRYYLDTGILLNCELNSLQQDDHCNAGIFLTDDGYLAIAESVHNGNSYCRPAAAKNCAVAGRTSAIGTADAYAQMIQVGDTAKDWVWYFRNGSGTTRPQSYRTSTDRGSTWSAGTDLVTVTNQIPYFQHARSDTNNKKVWHAFTNGHPQDTTCSLYLFYTLFADDGTQTRYKPDGTQITASLPLAATDAAVIYNSDNCWVWDIQIFNDIPHVYFTTFASSFTLHTYHRAVVNGATVTVTDIDTGGTATPHHLTAGGSGQDAYSIGICGDPNDQNACYVGRVTATDTTKATTSEIYKYTISGSTWTQGASISGNTGSLNARPRVVRGCSPTETLIAYWRATKYNSYTDYSGGIVLWSSVRGEMPLNSYSTSPGKPASAVWQSAYAPPGVKLYLPLTEGSGTPSDYVPSGHTPSIVGSLTWGSDSYGNYLTGFSTSNYLSLGNVQTLSYSTLPIMMLVVFRNSSTTQQYLISQGRSSTNNPLLGLAINFNSVAGTVCAFIQNNSGGSGNNNVTITGTACNDGNVHTLGLIITPTTRHVWFDSKQSTGLLTVALGTATFDRFTLGALRRTTVASPCLGNIYGAYVCGGDMQDISGLEHNIMTGRFSAITVPASGRQQTFSLLGVGA